MVLDRVLGLLGLFILAGVAGLAVVGRRPSNRGQDPDRSGLGRALLAGLIGLTVVFSPTIYRPLNRLVAGKGKLEKIVKRAGGDRLWPIASGWGRSPLMLDDVSVLSHTACYVLAFYCASLALFDVHADAGPALPDGPARPVQRPPSPCPFGALGLSESDQRQAVPRWSTTMRGSIAMMAFRILMYASGAFSACVYLANIKQVQALSRDAGEVVDAAIGASIASTAIVGSGEAAG